MSRKWYHVEVGNEQWRDKIARHLRKNRIVYEVKDAGRHYDWWIVRFLIAEPKQLDELRAFLQTV